MARSGASDWARLILRVATALCCPLSAVAALAQTSPADSYVVQVAAERTEGEVRLAYQALQRKYPADLGPREVIIRRVEHPGGALYQGEIGPFGTATEADAPCDRLTAAGGACVVVLAPQPSRAAPAATPPVAPTASEPRRVKTIVIRPDGSEANGVSRQSAPIAVSPAAPGTSETKRIRSIPIRPDGSTAAAPNVDAPQPAVARPGAYTVQVTAQRTEGEAETAYRAMQQKYPSVLGGREPIIRKVELAGAGTWYRAQVGPFGTPSEADAFCMSLKAAGGQCIVQRN